MTGTYGERVMTVWRLDTGELKLPGKTQPMVANGTTWGYITMKAKKCKSRRWKEAYEGAKGNVARREYHFRRST